ncbi:TRAP transporter large permease subunit [Neobacillus sp. YX16]|uniref:TRAP transporter large permease n=1 Tax=Neobacillus sp. YX16 TaxID=3047874 RepID=UPI0024C2D1E1|nr:TRAP transporter large permease subunit [Neobacillus sp. YX16]WHZ00871.1 TRAP transporter large permease subunit [Neobacillus sp. YX16]
MEWYYVILLFFFLLLLFIFSGFPVAFAFFSVNIIVTTIFVGFNSGINTLVGSTFDALSKFSLTPVPLFVLMGELLFHSGIVMTLLDAFSKLIGKVPGRLSILAIGTGTILSTMSGSAVSDSAMLGSTLAPEMRRRGYHLAMIVGPIVAAGTLGPIIPPSTLGVLLGSTARVPVGDLLIAGVVPGIVIAVILVIYYITISCINPALAPNYDYGKSDWKEKSNALFVYIIPMSSLIFMVLGLIMFGLVTPTESAATGVLGSIILMFVYRRFSFKVLIKSLLGTVRVTSMILLIIAGSAGFSQLLSYTGATRELVDIAMTVDTAPIVIIILMLIIVLILGMFIEPISIMMITIPLYIPVVTALEFDLIWFCTLMLICLGLGNVTPPFGLLLFVMKGVLPGDVKTTDIYKAVISIVVIEVIAVICIMIFPEIATWLPSLSKSG